MTIKVTEALDSDTAIKLTVKRTPFGVFVDGIWIEGTATNFKILGSPQQPTPEEVAVLPEGERAKDMYKFFCNKKLQVTNDKEQTIADEIYFKGFWFKVIKAESWDTFGHCIAYAVRL